MAADSPEAIEDTSWLAVRRGTVEAVVEVLGLSDPRPASWSQGMAVVGGYHEDCPGDWGEIAGVFITPLVRGWRLAVGHFLGAAPLVRPEEDLRTSGRRVAGWCRRLSRDFTQAHAFTDQPQMDWYSWILARHGSILRQVVFEDGKFLSNRGQRSGVEDRLIAHFRPNEVQPRWQPDVGDVPKIGVSGPSTPGELARELA
ncbi:MAG: hypothetical protein JO112_12830 [Planctomycetes bacterium]|nr:hypothetical protein [Planctomycetota bacterium]